MGSLYGPRDARHNSTRHERGKGIRQRHQIITNLACRGTLESRHFDARRKRWSASVPAVVDCLIRSAIMKVPRKLLASSALVRRPAQLTAWQWQCSTASTATASAPAIDPHHSSRVCTTSAHAHAANGVRASTWLPALCLCHLEPWTVLTLAQDMNRHYSRPM